MHAGVRGAAMLGASWVLTSCAFDVPAAHGPEMVDSAGVSIVLNISPSEEWTPATEAALRIGSVDGGEAYLFHRVRFAGHLSDGRLAVADAAAHEIRWFDEAGVHVASFGRRGEGPGEFQDISQVQITGGDTLVVYDSRSHRVTWITPEGRLARSLALPRARFPELAGVTSAGTVVMSERSSRPSDSRTYAKKEGWEGNYVREELEIIALDESGPRTIMQMHGSESARWVRFSDGRPVATLEAGLPFGYVTLTAVAGEHVVTGSTESRQLEWHDASGSLLRVARRLEPAPTPLTDEHRTRYVRHFHATAEARGIDPAISSQDARDRLDLVPEGRLLPSFDRMLTDPDGRVWLREYVPVWAEAEPQQWTVHDHSGILVASVRLPTKLRVMHVRGDRVTGVERDEMDVEYVVSYTLH